MIQPFTLERVAGQWMVLVRRGHLFWADYVPLGWTCHATRAAALGEWDAYHAEHPTLLGRLFRLTWR